MIQFNNYEPLQIKEVTLNLRNKDKVPRMVKIIPPDSKLFQIVPTKKSGKKNVGDDKIVNPKDVDIMDTKVAPGMELTYKVRFSPEAQIDYSYDLIIVTERERFIVPIRAVGCRAIIDFLDVIDFGNPPVKYEMEKLVLIHNMGTKAAKWQLRIEPGQVVKVNKSEGILEPTQSEHLVFIYKPLERRQYKEMCILSYDGLTAYTELKGSAHIENVDISKTHIDMKETYNGLFSQDSLQIINNSSVPVEFSWHAFQTLKIENEKKEKLRKELELEEEQERNFLEQGQYEDNEAESLDSDDSYDEDEQNKKRERAQAKAIAILTRKFAGLKKALEEDKMLAQDDIFNIEPTSGKIWPNSEITCIVTFKPQGPITYSGVAFLEITGCEHRKQLDLTGKGIGPKAALSMNEWDIGDIFVNQKKVITFEISNVGMIPCEFSLEKKQTAFSSKFDFNCESGILEVGSPPKKMEFEFHSDKIGELCETFNWKLKGSNEMLIMTIRGQVVPPTFTFSEQLIDFGNVSYGFEESRTIELKNTSDVLISYNLRVQQDDKEITKRQFEIIHARGAIEGAGKDQESKASITIIFKPTISTVFDMNLVADIDGVGQDMASIPIRAKCITPTVEWFPNEILDFKNVFLRSPKTEDLRLSNTSSAKAKFVVQPQDESSKRVALITVDPMQGEIEPKSDFILKVTLKPEMPNSIKLPLNIDIPGVQANKPKLMLCATSQGPNVKVEQKELEFGDVQVLQDKRMKLTIHNESGIPADYTAFTRDEKSIWMVAERKGTLQPNEAKQIEVTCNADECMRFNDILHFVICDGMDFEVPLRARGVGTTIFCKDDLSMIDFNVQYIYKEELKSFIIENRGRKNALLTWKRVNNARSKKPEGGKKAKEEAKKEEVKKEEKKKEEGKKEEDKKEEGKKEEAKKEEEEEETKLFKVFPESFTLAARKKTKFTFIAYSTKPGKFQEEFLLNTMIEKERKPKKAMSIVMTALFIEPLITFSTKTLIFKYRWEKGQPPMPKTEKLKVKCESQLPTTFFISTSLPYSCEKEKVTLAPGQEEILSVNFDPSQSGTEMNTKTVKKQLILTHIDTVHKDMIDLIGHLYFPNLTVVPTQLNFGCILVQTSKKMYLTLQNNSDLDCKYQWNFIEFIKADIADEQRNQKIKKPSIPANEVFDIMPVCGILKSNESDVVEVTYNALCMDKYSITACCKVEGGPDIRVPLEAEANNIEKEISSKDINFKEIPFTEYGTEELVLYNKGKVPFDFNVNLSLSRPGIVDVSPMFGRVNRDSPIKIQIRVLPSIPQRIEESIMLEVAHLEPEKVTLKARGIYPAVYLSLPRYNDDEFKKYVKSIEGIDEEYKLSHTVLEKKPSGRKSTTTQRSTLTGFEQAKMELEAEADRKKFCSLVTNKLNQSQARFALAMQAKDKKNLKELFFGEKESNGLHQLYVSQYVCDFENVVIGSDKKRKTFKLYSVGQLPVSFILDKKKLKASGIEIIPDKETKLMPGESKQYTIEFSTRDKAEKNKVEVNLPIEVKGGPQYNIIIRANLTFPELTISNTDVDFEKVMVGNQKEIKVKLENNKEVDCSWSLSTRQELTSSKDQSFTVEPSSGVLYAGRHESERKQILTIKFMPTQEKPYTQKLTFKIIGNKQPAIINLTGVGKAYELGLKESSIEIGPILPYDDNALKPFDIKNPLDIPIEIYSSDFDSLYREEEEMILGANILNENEFTLLPVRNPGDSLWKEVRASYEFGKRTAERKAKIEQITKKMEEIKPKAEPAAEPPAEADKKAKEDATKEIEKLQKSKEDIEQEQLKDEAQMKGVKYPSKVKKEKKIHYILYGPEKCGKTMLAQYMNDIHERGIVSVQDIVEWARNNNPSLYKKAEEILIKNAEKLKIDIEEREKLQKKKRKGQPDEPIINEASYKWLPANILEEIINSRLQHPDCNAGIIFDNLKGENWENELFIVKCLCRVIHDEQIVFIVYTNVDEAKKDELLKNKKSLTDPKQSLNADQLATKLPKDLTNEQKLSYNESIKALYSYIEKAKTGFEPVKEEPKKEEKKDESKKDEKKAEKKKEEKKAEKKKEETKEEEKSPAIIEESVQKQEGQRVVNEIPNIYDMHYMILSGASFALPPEFVDPVNEPLPPPVTMQAVKKPAKRKDNKKDFLKFFKILTPKLKKIEKEGKDEHKEGENKKEEKSKEAKENKKEEKPKETKEERKERENKKEEKPKDGKDEHKERDNKKEEKSKEPKEEGENKKEEISKQEPKYEQIYDFEEKYRWILMPNQTQKLFVKFFCKVPNIYDTTLDFQIVGAGKKYTLAAKADCCLPTILPSIENIIITKKKKPRTSAQSGENEIFVNRRHNAKDKVFDFGPLLIGKNEENKGQFRKQNSITIKLTNNSKYDAHCDVVARGLNGEDTPFRFDPPSIDIKKEQSSEVTVWAFPSKVQVYRDQFICLLANNPEPMLYDLACEGASPIVEVDSNKIQFERLLLNHQSTKEIKIKNKGKIPVKWMLTSEEPLPDEFFIDVTSGVLMPYDKEREKTIKISMIAKREEKYDFKINIKVEDNEGLHSSIQDIEITINAESFKVLVEPIFESDAKQLNFESLLIGEAKEKEITVKNLGLYEVKYSLDVVRSVKNMFTLINNEGTLTPNEAKSIKIQFKSKEKKEIKNNTSEISLSIIESKNNTLVQKLPICYSANVVFNIYSLNPPKSLNFGPMQFDDSKVRSFEIKNDGTFDFNYILYDAHNAEIKKEILERRKKEVADLGTIQEVILEKGKKQAKKDEKKKVEAKDPKKKGKVEDCLTIDKYGIKPYEGVIKAGASETIEVTFTASGSQICRSELAIDISGRDMNEFAEGSTLELIAESCYPGIQVEDKHSIFEEQTVVDSLDPSIMSKIVVNQMLYSIEENVFWFGTLVASKSPDGASEKFKITNPNKIPSTINISVKPRTNSKSEGFAFDVTPTQAKIQPHEFTYVKVSFKPTNMMSYGGIFEAVVEKGDPSSKQSKLVFDIKGEGTLPSLTLDQPSMLNDKGIPVLKFKKTRAGLKSNMSMVLKNDGSVPATVHFDPLTSDVFSLISTANTTISAKSYASFEIAFEPKKQENYDAQLQFSTVHNPYENNRIALFGEGYCDNIVIEDLPKGFEDELHFDETCIGKEKSVTFKLSNKGKSTIRFEWNILIKGVKFSPSVGFLNPGASKSINAIYCSKEEATITGEEISCKLLDITTKAKDWDNGMVKIRKVKPSEFKLIMKQREEEEEKKRKEFEEQVLSARKKQAGKKDAKKEAPKKAEAKKEEVKEKPKEEEIKVDDMEEATMEIKDPIPEPEYTPGEEKSLNLKVFAVADYVKYECDTKHIAFRPTLMYQTRSHKFSVKNISQLTMNYKWKIVNSETAVPDSGPYTVIPKAGTIAAGCNEMFILKFSPTEVEETFERLLICSIQDLPLEMKDKPFVIELNGEAERPICHFELAPSKYKEKKEKDMNPIDEKYSIIEFESLGTKVKNIKRFMVVNPTSQGYEFEWIEHKSTDQSYFRCVNQKGVILSGKKYEMVFEYTPENVGTHESYWTFIINKENLKKEFLVVGSVVEPIVMFNVNKVNFGPLLVSGKNREEINLVNQEHIPFNFYFEKDSVKGGTDYGDSLKVVPFAGVVPPQGHIKIDVLFQPIYERAYNYNLICHIKKKTRPLCLNVKGVGYTIHHEVLLENRVIIPKEEQLIDFGDIFINEQRTKTVMLVNSGDFNFDYIWKKSNSRAITISPESASVKKTSKLAVTITFLPAEELKLNMSVSLVIVSGPTYAFNIIGSSRKPGVKFNFYKYDFGPCFVFRQPQQKTAYLEIVNKDNIAMSVETKYEKQSYLDIQLSPGQVILPYTEEGKEKLKVPIVFVPRNIQKYSDTIKFDFNGLYQIDLLVTGEGIPCVLELEKAEDQYIDLGIVPVKGEANKTAYIVNKSRKEITFSVYPEVLDSFVKAGLSLNVNGICVTEPEESPIKSPKGKNYLKQTKAKEKAKEKKKEDAKDSNGEENKDEKKDKEITISLKPKQSAPIDVIYKPTARMPLFKHDLLLKVLDDTRKLITVSCASHGIEVKLMEESLSFGTVVQNSILTKKLKIVNLGDIAAKYHWNAEEIKEKFTISPLEGKLLPQEELNFDIAFHPTTKETNIKYEVLCHIDNSEPLKVILLGACNEQGVAATPVKLKTIVRKEITEKISIQNTTDSIWKVSPTISSQNKEYASYFTGPANFEVPAKGKADYIVTYLPLTMTTTKDTVTEFHKATLFFPFPDGTASMYNLQGQADAPECTEQITSTTKAKLSKYIPIPVKNWLKQSQRFKVIWKLDESCDKAVFLKGANTFDIPGGSSKEFRLNFTAYKDGECKFTVTFTNETSGEYIFYDVVITVEEPDVIATHDMSAVVRETTTKSVTLENPLDTNVEIKKEYFEVDNDYIFINPSSFTIPAHKESGFEIVYRPMIMRGEECEIKLTSPELGIYRYKLNLKGLKQTTQRSLHFKTSLGSESVQVFRFVHYLKKQTIYNAKIERISASGAQGGVAPEFKADPISVTANAVDNQSGKEYSINIKFEPNSLGDSAAILILTNPDGVEYSCLLYGHSSPPQPYGPIKLMSGKAVNVDFKNSLTEKTEFVFRFDNPAFSIAGKPPGPIEPGKQIAISVKYDFNAAYANTGRMIVTAKGLPPWSYYLHGEK